MSQNGMHKQQINPTAHSQCLRCADGACAREGFTNKEHWCNQSAWGQHRSSPSSECCSPNTEAVQLCQQSSTLILQGRFAFYKQPVLELHTCGERPALRMLNESSKLIPENVSSPTKLRGRGDQRRMAPQTPSTMSQKPA